MIALITDKEGKIILQRRGPESRDENYMLEDIGGALEISDKNIREGLKREIKEEVGDIAKVVVDKFIGGFLNTKHDNRIDEDINWLFMVYKCNYIDGELKIKEKGKCLGYEFIDRDELNRNDIALSTKYYWDFYYNKL